AQAARRVDQRGPLRGAGPGVGRVEQRAPGVEQAVGVPARRLEQHAGGDGEALGVVGGHEGGCADGREHERDDGPQHAGLVELERALAEHLAHPRVADGAVLPRRSAEGVPQREAVHGADGAVEAVGHAEAPVVSGSSAARATSASASSTRSVPAVAWMHWPVTDRTWATCAASNAPAPCRAPATAPAIAAMVSESRPMLTPDSRAAGVASVARSRPMVSATASGATSAHM